MADTIEKRMADDSLMQCRIEDLEAENERLRDALKPFADEAEEWKDFLDDESIAEPWPDGPVSLLRVRDLRRAARVINEATND